MAETMQYDLVAPERRVSAGEARSVQVPGSEGDLTAMLGHAPFITTLRPGLVIIEHPSGEEEHYAVTGGFVEITNGETAIMAEEAMHVGEVTEDFLKQRIERAERAHEEEPHTGGEAARKLISDLVALGDKIDIPVESRFTAP